MTRLNKLINFKNSLKKFSILKGTSHSISQECTDSSQKRLSTIAESSSGGVIEQNPEESGEFGSGKDVIV